MRCDRPISLRVGCSCESQGVGMGSVVPMWGYDRCVRKLISRFKYEGRRTIIKELFLATRPNKIFDIYNVLCRGDKQKHLLAVPLHSSKIKKRGFNQSQIVTEIFGKLTDMSIIRPGVVVRKKETKQQVVAEKREERLANMRGVFEVVDAAIIRGKDIVLIDDVYTTGATIKSLASELILAGATGVDAFVLSHNSTF
jgi:competence protein ComFC